MDPNYLYKVTKAAIGANIAFCCCQYQFEQKCFKKKISGEFISNPTKEFINIIWKPNRKLPTGFITDINGKWFGKNNP